MTQPTDHAKPAGFGDNPLDRQALIRADAARINALHSSDDARFLVLAGERILVDVGADPHQIAFAQTRVAAWCGDEPPVFLGTAGETPLFAVIAPDDLALPDEIKPIDLRSLALQGLVAPHWLGIAAQARSLTHWHATHRFCSRCGAPSTMTEGGYRRDCDACGGLHFPRTDPVAIMLIERGGQCLLGRSGRFEQPMYSTLAGFIEPGETIEDAVRREVFEEAGIVVDDVRYHSSQPWPFPASLMIGCVGIGTSEAITIDEAELVDVRWFPRDEVKKMAAGTHPDGLIIPPAISIAHQLIADWLAA